MPNSCPWQSLTAKLQHLTDFDFPRHKTTVKEALLCGVVYDSLGGSPPMTKYEDILRNFMGLTTNKEIEWSYGTTARQPDSWSCGYKVMHGMVDYLQALEEICLTLRTTEDNVIQVTERWTPSFFAHSRGSLCFIPDGIF